MFAHSGQRGEAGFSLVEVVLATALLGVCGAGLLNAMQQSLMGSRAVERTVTNSLSVRWAMEAVAAAPYVSCATSPTPYATLPNGLSIPTGVTITVLEFSAQAANPWQPCASVQTPGAAQMLTFSNGTASGTRSTLRFAPQSSTASPQNSSTPTQTATPTSTASPTPTSSKCGHSQGAAC